MVNERRGYHRAQVVWKATLTRLNGEQLPGSTDNVSSDGLNVILDKELVLGEPVRIDIVTPCRHGTCFFKLDGVIVYSNALEHNLGNAVGLKLLEPDTRYLQLVEALDCQGQRRFGIA